MGAFAKDVTMLAKGHESPPDRKTKDVDLAVMVDTLDEYEMLKNAISVLPEFEQHEELPYRFIFQNAYELISSRLVKSPMKKDKSN